MMKVFLSFLSFCCFLLLSSCMEDPRANNSVPDTPIAYYSNLTDSSVVLLCEVNTRHRVLDMGIELIEDGFNEGKIPQVFHASDDSRNNVYSVYVNIKPETRYVFRVWVTNGRETKYSLDKSFISPLRRDSIPSLSEIRFIDGVLLSSIDNGGYHINEVGFICSDTKSTFQSHRKYPAETWRDSLFSLSSLSLVSAIKREKKTKWFICSYAEYLNEPDKAKYVYSTVFPVTVLQINDVFFDEYLINLFDLDGNLILTDNEIELITIIRISSDIITSVSEIRSMPNLQYLSVSGSSKGAGLLDQLDVSNNISLYSLDCSNNNLTSLDVFSNTALEYLDCSNNNLKILDISKNGALEYLDCSGNPNLTEVYITHRPRTLIYDKTNTKIISQ